jgi:hypothetical protein
LAFVALYVPEWKGWRRGLRQVADARINNR